MSKSGEFYGFLSLFLGSFQWLGLVSCGFVFGTVLYPYLFIQLYSAFSEKFHNYSIASSSLGKSKIEFINKIGFRIMLFPLASGLFLIAVETLNDYGAVKYYGVNTFTFGIFKVWFGLGDLGTALLLSLVLVSAIVGLKLIVDSFKLGSDSIKASQNKITLSSFSKKSILLTISLLPPTIGLIIPTLYSLYSCDYREIEKLFELGGVSFLSTSIGEAILNTAYLSGSSAFIVLAFTLILVLSNYIFKKGKSSSIIQQLAIGGYYVPGAVVALSVMALFVAFGSVANSLFHVYLGIGSWLWIPIILAYTFRYFQVCYSPIQNAFSGLASKSVDMSRSIGKSIGKSIFKIGFPVIKLEIISATIIVFIDIAKDLPLTLILRDYGQETLATMAYRYANDERLVESMPYGLLLIAVSSLSVFISIAISQNRKVEINN
ncbi:MAG: hypothetical protein Kapaf2KO_22810 [Candidatus Kapaibacteriales bacterium]